MKLEKKYWLDEPGNVRTLYRGLWIVCVLLVLGDLLYHKHIHFAPEGWFAFYGLFGFLSYVFIVNAAKLLRKLVMRREDYYDQ